MKSISLADSFEFDWLSLKASIGNLSSRRLHWPAARNALCKTVYFNRTATGLEGHRLEFLFRSLSSSLAGPLAASFSPEHLLFHTFSRRTIKYKFMKFAIIK